MSDPEQSWKAGKTPDEIARLEVQGEKLAEHLRWLDANPDVPPSPREGTSIRQEIEKRQNQSQKRSSSEGSNIGE